MQSKSYKMNGGRKDIIKDNINKTLRPTHLLRKITVSFSNQLKIVKDTSLTCQKQEA